MKASEIAHKASELVGGERNETHGDMATNHSNIASMWNAYLKIRRNPGSPLDGEDVALMMALLKLARTQTGAFNADDHVDLCGYAAVAGEIAQG
jgi:hypothetical protein